MRLRSSLLGGKKTAFNQPKIWENQSILNMLGDGLTNNRESIGNNYEDYIHEIYRSNGVVFACMLTRMMVLSEARFQYQDMTGGRPGDLTDSPDLRPFNDDKTNMVIRFDQDASLAGNAYYTYCDDKGVMGRGANPETRYLARMRPDQTDLIIYSPSGDPWGIDAVVIGAYYTPNWSAKSDTKRTLLLRDEFIHYAPIPDPSARFRGMSWLTPVLRDIGADGAAVAHKKKFFENGATLGHVVRFAEGVGPDEMDEFVNRFKANHQGHANAYKTLFLGGGADLTTVGTDLRQLEFSQTQGHGETKIAAASGVPPVIVGLSEGLQAATYSNYSQARRRFADGTLRPLWRIMANACSNVLDVPAGKRLWYDDRDIPFLREDKDAAAKIVQTEAQSIRALTEAGFVPETVIRAVVAGDLTLLKHSGLMSVQLVPPLTEEQAKRDAQAALEKESDLNPDDDKPPADEKKPAKEDPDVSKEEK